MNVEFIDYEEGNIPFFDTSTHKWDFELKEVVALTDAEIEAEIAALKQKEERDIIMKEKFKKINNLKKQLDAISEDIIQDAAGESVPAIKQKKAEFIYLHNELRSLESKAPRKIKKTK